MLEIVSKSQTTNIFVLRTKRVKKKCCLSNRVGLNGLHRNIPLFSLKIPKPATKKSKFRVLPAGRLMCDSNRWLTIPPPGISLFQRKNRWYSQGREQISSGSPYGREQISSDSPWVGNKYPVITHGLGTEDLWCPNPFPGGGWSTPDLNHTLYQEMKNFNLIENFRHKWKQYQK